MSNKKAADSNTQTDSNTPADSSVPKEFLKIMKDFLTDMISTFPEYKKSLEHILLDIVEEKEDSESIKD